MRRRERWRVKDTMQGQIEIMGPDNKVHYRRPSSDNLVEQALTRHGYWVRPEGSDWTRDDFNSWQVGQMNCKLSSVAECLKAALNVHRKGGNPIKLVEAALSFVQEEEKK